MILHARIATLAGDDGYGVIEDGAIAWREGRIVWLGPTPEFPRPLEALSATAVDAHGALLTPGLIDAHTHLVFAGERAQEFEQRLQGASYEAIARAGGGILATVRATRAADEASLLAASLPRARALLADGVTTLEIKSGYALDLPGEARMLRVARRIGNALGIEVRTTLLGLHALPAEFSARRTDYVREVCTQWLPHLHAEGLVDAVDAFCDGIGFSVEETRTLFTAARALRLPIKLHADQLSNLHGAALAAEFAALSADHLECTDAAGVAALAAAGTVAMLLPGSFYVLRETRLPPIAALRAAHVPMAVATDLNPGTAPLRSLRAAMNMACTLFGLTPLEALRGVTVHAARALALNDRGRLAQGLRADLVLWDATAPAELSYWIGGTLARTVIAAGQRVV
ncbi:MAG: imidazolonepropionase [Metallibacterium scheffleri]|jgi:imidazolonepropionase|uniref:imidazolonepropionase n=1 Tax=Metallibacterium scheffleri TaxID=993689 RepID=UPI0026EAE336|nr:imidazolonepropionase [Metallibacterium scheffleri]MCK9367734.1 imidazolonepropionase [Metallibacterium scheffleri]